MPRYLSTLILGLALLFVGCDVVDSDDPPEPAFSVNLGGPVETTLDGEAAMTHEDDLGAFDDELFDALPIDLDELDLEATVIQLPVTEGGTSHLVGIVYLGDGLPEEGPQDVDSSPFDLFDLFSSAPNGAFQFPLPDEILIASYSRADATNDELLLYPVEGNVTFDQVSEDAISGSLELSADRELTFALSEVLDFADDAGDLDEFPDPEREELDDPLTLEGSFTALPEDIDDLFAFFPNGS